VLQIVCVLVVETWVDAPAVAMKLVMAAVAAVRVTVKDVAIPVAMVAVVVVVVVVVVVYNEKKTVVSAAKAATPSGSMLELRWLEPWRLN
jgi:hypothetical protein